MFENSKIPGPELFAAEMGEELNQILNWWVDHLWAPASKSWHGRINGRGELDPSHPRSIILYTRLLWTYAAAARKIDRSKYHGIADDTFRYLETYFWDTRHGGLFSMLDAEGNPLDTKKQIYAQAFGIYAFSEYYLLTGASPALNLADQLYTMIETYSFDKDNNGYFEAFDREWRLLSDMRLSAKDANEAKTMNTHLHLLEAYTLYATVSQNKVIHERLSNLINLFSGHFINPTSHHLNLFFDERWNCKGDLISYGHDIEASWLLTEACNTLGEPRMISDMHQMSLRMVEAVIANGIAPDGSIWYERKGDHLDQERHWWPQIEAVVGLINAWQIVQNPYYYLLAYRTWEYIKKQLIDRMQGEWYWSILANGTPNEQDDKAGPWKANYHNGRGCMEIMSRLMTL